MMQNKEIVVFGAGAWGKRLIETFNCINIHCVVDNDEKKWGTSVNGIEVCPPHCVKKLSEKYQLVIASRYADEMSMQLEKSGVAQYCSVTYRFIAALNTMKSYIESNVMDHLVIIVKQNLWNVVESLLCAMGKGGIARYCEFSELDDFEVSAQDIIIVLEEERHREICYLLSLKKVKKVVDLYKKERYCDTDELITKQVIGGEQSSDEDLNWADNVNRKELIESVNFYTRFIEAKGKVPLFHLVEVETINKCNGSCSFCPVNVKDDIREHIQMSDELFERIIEQLERIDYAGRISLFSNNEPFLDSKIVERHKYARNHLPHAKMHIITNGTLLTVDKFIEIIQYLDEMIIDNYNQEFQLLPSVKKVADYCEQHPELKKKVTIILRKQQEMLSSRGGDAPNRKQFLSYEKDSCALPFQQIVIRPDGKISLCCCDPYGRMTLGDVNKDNLVDIWYNEIYADIREKITKGRKEISHCVNCDYFQVY